MAVCFGNKRCQDRASKKQEMRFDLKNNRVNARTDRTFFRQQGRTDRNADKRYAQSVAYQNGIDPKAAMWQGLSSMVQSAGATAVGIANPLSAQKGGNLNMGTFGTTGNNPNKDNTMMYAIIGLGALMMLKK